MRERFIHGRICSGSRGLIEAESFGGKVGVLCRDLVVELFFCEGICNLKIGI